MTNPLGAPAAEVIQKNVRYPGADGDPRAYRDELEVTVVRHQAADERRGFFGDYAGRPKSDVGPQALQRRERVAGARNDEEQRREKDGFDSRQARAVASAGVGMPMRSSSRSSNARATGPGDPFPIV